MHWCSESGGIQPILQYFKLSRHCLTKSEKELKNLPQKLFIIGTSNEKILISVELW